MPRKPKQPCAWPGCNRLSDGRYCKEHRTLVNREYNKYTRRPDINKRYGARWRKVREMYALAHPLCEECLKNGKATPVKEVHHKKPTSMGGTDDWENLESLCKSCHIKIHKKLGDR